MALPPPACPRTFDARGRLLQGPGGGTLGWHEGARQLQVPRTPQPDFEASEAETRHGLRAGAQRKEQPASDGGTTLREAPAPRLRWCLALRVAGSARDHCRCADRSSATPRPVGSSRWGGWGQLRVLPRCPRRFQGRRTAGLASGTETRQTGPGRGRTGPGLRTCPCQPVPPPGVSEANGRLGTRGSGRSDWTAAYERGAAFLSGAEGGGAAKPRQLS